MHPRSQLVLHISYEEMTMRKKYIKAHYEVIDIEDDTYTTDDGEIETVQVYTIAEIAADGTYLGTWREYNLI